MSTTTHRARVNIYLDNPELRTALKLAATRGGESMSAYCLAAIRRRLRDEGLLSEGEPIQTRREAAATMDRIRREIGPIGIPMRDLIAAGRQ